MHGFVSARIPLAVGIALKVTLTNQRLLDFFYALRLQVKARQTLLSGERARPAHGVGGEPLVMGSVIAAVRFGAVFAADAEDACGVGFLAAECVDPA